jgi:hypothetical protein
MWPEALLVAVIDHRGQRGRFAGTGGADHQDQAALFHDHVLQHRRQAEGLEFRDVDRDVARHQGRRAALEEAGEPENADVGRDHPRLQFPLALQLRQLVLVEDFGEEVAHRRRIEDGRIDRHRIAEHLDGDRGADREKQVRRLFFRHQLEQPLHRTHAFLLCLPSL